MIEITRIVEHQANLSSYRATRDVNRAVQLELLIKHTEPLNSLYPEWHPLISTPFQYSPPHPEARFRAPFSRNVFYGSIKKETAFYESAFIFMRERINLINIAPDIGERTLFSVDADNRSAFDLNTEKLCSKIMNKTNYTASHEFIEQHPEITFLIYPSCRDPKHQENTAIFDIHHLERIVKRESSIQFFYDYENKQLTWIDFRFQIKWDEVA